MIITESQLRKIVRQEISEYRTSLQESPGGGGAQATGAGGESSKDVQHYRHLMPNLFLALEKEIQTRSPHLTWQYLTQKITRLSYSGILEDSRMKELESMYNDGLVSVYDVFKELELSS